jgi:hypothetical protein
MCNDKLSPNGLERLVRMLYCSYELSGFFAFFYKMKIVLTGHMRRPHVAKNNIWINAGISGDNYSAWYTFFNICTVRAFLTIITESSFFKNTLNHFPVNRCYAWHAVAQVPETENGIGMEIKR